MIALWNPDRDSPRRRKLRRKLPKFLKRSEIDALLSCADRLIESCGRGANHKKRIVCSVGLRRYAEQDRLIVQLGVYLGLRQQEIAGLLVEHIDLVEKNVYVCGKGDVEAYLPIPGRLHDELAAWCHRRKRGLLLRNHKGKRMHGATINERLERLAKLAGLTKHVHCHMLRHTFATRLLEEGVDLATVRDLMRHQNIATTSIYLHCDPARRRSAVDLL